MYLAKNGKAYHVQLTSGDIGRYVLLPGDPFRTDMIASCFDDPVLVAHNREHKTWTGTLDGVKVSVTSTGMGCPSTAIAVEELIGCGADTLIRVGTAGRVCDASMDPKINGVIATAAVRDEGTTRQYIPVEYPAVADIDVVSALTDAAQKNGYRFVRGIVQSKDSFYGEVEPDSVPCSEMLHTRWNAWKAGHVMASEMESAALFVISSIRQVRAGTILSFTDINHTIQTAVDAVRILIAKDRQGR